MYIDRFLARYALLLYGGNVCCLVGCCCTDRLWALKGCKRRESYYSTENQISKGWSLKNYEHLQCLSV